jgi:predicted transcriptional regulator
MEIKINKEIRAYKENIFFGLSMRQFFCAIIAVGVAVMVYFVTKDVMHKEITSWLCIVCSVPIAAAGFVTYHGLTLEKFILAFIRSEFVYPRRLLFKACNIYKEATKDYYTRLKHNEVVTDDMGKPDVRIRNSSELFGYSVGAYDGLSNDAKLIYGVLLDHSEANNLRISFRAIMAASGLKAKDTKAAIKELDTAGLVIPRKGGFHLIKQ